MKSLTYKLIVMALLMLPAVGIAKTIELSAELDRAMLMPNETQTVYQRAGLQEGPYIKTGGSAELYTGVQTGANEVYKFSTNQRVNPIVLLSNRLDNVGFNSTCAFGKLTTDLIDEGLSVTIIGVGNGYNKDPMNRLVFRSDSGHYFCEEHCGSH